MAPKAKGATMTPDPEQRRSGQWTLIALFALFFLPLFIAMGWYAFAPGYTPPAGSNGELIDPAQPLEPFRASTASGDGLGLDAIRGRWHLIHVIPGPCGDECKQRLYHTRQVRDALGEDRSRVRRIAVVEQGADARELAASREEHPRLIVRPSASSGDLLRQLPAVKDARTVFLVDPNANLMMRFPGELEPGAVLDDLEKLLKLSRIG
jgi:cytochrome oxidase Cu insertion factor (SCO1/SenC/PrrC family)